MKPHQLTGICFIVWLLFLNVGCSTANSAAQAHNQNSNVPNQNANVPNMSKVEKPTPNWNGRDYTSKTFILNQEVLKNLDCNNQNAYNLVKAENHENHLEEESLTSQDLNIVVNNEVIVKIELPGGFEVKNFELLSTKKTKNGFDINTAWGGSLHYYKIQFDFRCKENNFYLYKVKTASFSTTNTDSRNFLDKKQTKVTKIEPNLPIEKFVIADYL
jgi:hypothetical protein